MKEEFVDKLPSEELEHNLSGNGGTPLSSNPISHANGEEIFTDLAKSVQISTPPNTPPVEPVRSPASTPDPVNGTLLGDYEQYNASLENLWSIHIDRSEARCRMVFNASILLYAFGTLIVVITIMIAILSRIPLISLGSLGGFVGNIGGTYLIRYYQMLHNETHRIWERLDKIKEEAQRLRMINNILNGITDSKAKDGILIEMVQYLFEALKRGVHSGKREN